MQTTTCQNCKKDFNIDSDDISFYEKMQVPAPTFCPMCRAQRRLAFRNERGLYKRKSDYSGKEIFSMFSPDSPVKVYERDVWLSDAWDPMDYGMDIDWSRPFLAQLHELMIAVPYKAVNVIRGTGSEYSNNATDPKNCFLVFNATNPEECMYSNGINFSKECFDVSHVSKAESCYESFWLTSCYRVNYSSQCVESSDLLFCRDCQGCMNCFGSVNLRNKNYCFFNEQLSREDYLARVAEYKLNTREGVERAKNDAHNFWNKFPNKNHQGIKNVDSTGSYVSNSKNTKDSFLVREGENIRYCQSLQEIPGCKDCYDYSIWGDAAELVYESSSCGTGIQNVKFGLFTQENMHDTEYTVNCSNGGSDLFGCVGLRKKQYCILNKQYSKEEYAELVEKIKKHMTDMPYVDKNGRVYKYGEFLPIEFSAWAYNETLAQEFFPLTKEQAEAAGYTWRDAETRNYVPTILAENIPDDINTVDEKITGEIFECAHRTTCGHNCTKAFRVMPDELTFYKKNNIPLPTLCPACRTMERLDFRLKLDLYKTECMCAGDGSKDLVYKNQATHDHGASPCERVFETGVPPESGRIVYCEHCYSQEVA
ncbi:MAG: hypothetical protein KBD48_03105 [Candidatus Pacebacteria bacterium]|nr:hypothetical protein [Candidatus Paceibacterota bacterium]MBP9716148.1 hypothetical protein [Candidatus Paceibacterota bacterium]